eukprot:CAMPEP_0179145522 /NCGR_PEP_ID=MMETSP0796-20121207/70215_1 /TAXON_ID=73915 /ORGANISM="Pyrodinium bahamense, Strain pbaha01" /LENGTH=45 /DNA_ID= /DNA_START= /DNA_END= /DNA_ORIENTATION=
MSACTRCAAKHASGVRQVVIVLALPAGALMSHEASCNLIASITSL